MNWVEEPIAAHHDRRAFRCGVGDLDTYLARYARQNHESGGALTFVATPEPGSPYVRGYYSIAPGAVEHEGAPVEVTRGLGRYPVPVFRLARLAVHVDHQGQGLGAELLMAAGMRALGAASQAGGVALAIDAIDDAAARWYARHGAIPFADNPLLLVLPLTTIAAALEAAERPS